MLYHWVELDLLRAMFSAARVPVRQVRALLLHYWVSGHVVLLGRVTWIMIYYWVGLFYIIGLNLLCKSYVFSSQIGSSRGQSSLVTLLGQVIL